MGGFGPWPGRAPDGGSGGGFFSDIYDAGVADSPSVDNLMTGTTQQFFINLGATPPPFPPTNPAFFPESGLFIGENPADSGVGADSKPLWRFRRWISTFPSNALHIDFETRYDLFGSGINSITGGDTHAHVLVDQFENRLGFANDQWQLTRPGLFAPGYTPLYLDNSPVTYFSIAMMDAIGGGNTNVWTFNSDGAQFRRVLIPNVVGGGGGAPGPWNYIANGMSMWSRNGGEPLIGSRLYYDAITAQTFGDIDDSLGQLMLAQAVVLDDKNLGSGQAAGHGETWVRSTLGGPLTLVASWYDNVVDFPVEILVHQPSVILGLTVDGLLSTTGTVNVGADLNIGTGDVHAGQALTIGTTLNSGAPAVVYETPEMDFLAAPGTTYAFNMPTTLTGQGFAVVANRGQVTARDGTITTGPSLKIGNNGAHDNWIAAAVVPGFNAVVKNALTSTIYGTPPLPIPDGDAGPLIVEIDASAVAGTATTFKGKLLFTMVRVDLAP